MAKMSREARAKGCGGCLAVVIAIIILIAVASSCQRTHEASPAARRYTATQNAHERKAAAAERTRISAALKHVNDETGEAIFRGDQIDGRTLYVRVDADIWGPLSGQDQEIAVGALRNAWAGIYAQAHGGRKVTAGTGLTLRIVDLADKTLRTKDFEVAAP